jgi:hypothetical protein
MELKVSICLVKYHFEINCDMEFNAANILYNLHIHTYIHSVDPKVSQTDYMMWNK